MLQWRALAAGIVTSLVVAGTAWLLVGYVDAVAVIITAGFVAGLVTGVATGTAADEGWRAGGYHGMLAAGFAGVVLVVTAAAVAFTSSSLAMAAPHGPARTAAAVTASPLAVPLFALEGIAGGVAGTWLRLLLGGNRSV